MSGDVRGKVVKRHQKRNAEGVKISPQTPSPYIIKEEKHCNDERCVATKIKIEKSPSSFDKELEKCWKRFWDIHLYNINDFKKDIKSIVERDYVKKDKLMTFQSSAEGNIIGFADLIEKQKVLDAWIKYKQHIQEGMSMKKARVIFEKELMNK